MLSVCVAAGCSCQERHDGMEALPSLSAEPQFLRVKRRTLRVGAGADGIGDWIVVFVQPRLAAARLESIHFPAHASPVRPERINFHTLNKMWNLQRDLRWCERRRKPSFSVFFSSL